MSIHTSTAQAPCDADPGSIVVSSQSAFEIESGTDCKYDWLRLSGVAGETAGEKRCGEVRAFSHDSLADNSVTVQFHSDSSMDEPGFAIQLELKE